MDILDKIDAFISEDGGGTVGAGDAGADGVIGDISRTSGNNTNKIAKHVKKKNVIDPKKKKKKKDDNRQKLTHHLIEKIILDIEIGDVVLGGRFKNKKIKVNKIGSNEKGDVTINDRPFMKIRIPVKRPVDNPDDSEIDTDDGEGFTEVVY